MLHHGMMACELHAKTFFTHAVKGSMSGLESIVVMLHEQGR